MSYWVLTVSAGGVNGGENCPFEVHVGLILNRCAWIEVP